MTRFRTALAALFAALALVACGSGLDGCKGPKTTTQPRQLPTASLMLDFTPNAIHTGVYAALARHYDLLATASIYRSAYPV